MKKLVFLIGLFVAFSAIAKDCEEGAESADMVRDCVLAEDYKSVTSAYDSLVKVLKGNDDALKAIKDAQDSWLAFRQATCEYAAITYSGGAYSSDGRLDCQMEFNKARVKILKSYAKQASSH